MTINGTMKYKILITGVTSWKHWRDMGKIWDLRGKTFWDLRGKQIGV